MTADHFTDERLAAVLASIGDQLDVEGAAADAVVMPIQRRSHRLLAVAAAVVLVVALLAAIAPVRRTVGGWFTAGDTEVRLDPTIAETLDSLPAFIAEGRVMSMDAVTAAEDRLGIDLLLPDSLLGEPDGWLSPSEGGVIAVWNEGSTTLAVRRDTGGAVMVEKYTAMAGDATELPDLGDGGVLLRDEHIIVTPSRTARAGRVVVWQQGDLTIRLESELSESELLRVATELSAGWQ